MCEQLQNKKLIINCMNLCMNLIQNMIFNISFFVGSPERNINLSYCLQQSNSLAHSRLSLLFFQFFLLCQLLKLSQLLLQLNREVFCFTLKFSKEIVCACNLQIKLYQTPLLMSTSSFERHLLIILVLWGIFFINYVFCS